MTPSFAEATAARAAADLRAWLTSYGFRRSWTARLGYTPPYPHPGGLAPYGNTGSDEVRRQVRQTRRGGL